jgi:hypothetical protein
MLDHRFRQEAAMDYPRYKPLRTRAPGKGAFSDFAAAVLNGNVAGPRRPRTYRAWRKSAAQAPAGDKIEG